MHLGISSLYMLTQFSFIFLFQVYTPCFPNIMFKVEKQVYSIWLFKADISSLSNFEKINLFNFGLQVFIYVNKLG